MTDGLLRAKYAYFFGLFDTAGRGFLVRADLERQGSACAQRLGHAPGSAEADEVRELFLGLWDGGFAPLDPGAGQQLTREQFVRGCAATVADDPRAPLLGRVRDLAFALGDRDGDRLLSEADWVTFLAAALGVGEDEARSGFGVLDRDGVGQLGLMQVALALDDYFRSPEPKSYGNRIFGPRAVLP